MSTIFADTPKYFGIRGDHARIASIDGRVLIRAERDRQRLLGNNVHSTDQARALAAAIMAEADAADADEATQ